MRDQEFNLNVPYNLTQKQWKKVGYAYSIMDGWLGYGDGKMGLPRWYSFDDNEKHISVSVEPVGLHFFGKATNEHWDLWRYKMKVVMSCQLGIIVGEVEWGEVKFENEILPT